MKDIKNNQQSTTPRFMTIKAAAERAMVKPVTIKKLIREGLPVIRLNSRMIRIPVVEFDEWWTVKIEGGLLSTLVDSNEAIERWVRELSNS